MIIKLFSIIILTLIKLNFPDLAPANSFYVSSLAKLNLYLQDNDSNDEITKIYTSLSKNWANDVKYLINKIDRSEILI